MADPVLINVKNGTSATASTVVPFGFTPTLNNLLVLVVGSDDYQAGNPAGYTLPANCNQQSNLGHYLWFKRAAGTETSVAYSISSAATSAHTVLEYSNINTSATLNTSVGNQSGGGTQTWSTQAVTATGANRVFAIGSIGGALGSNSFTGIGTWLNTYVHAASSMTQTGTRDIIGTATLAFNGGSTSFVGATFEGPDPADRATGVLAIFNVSTYSGGGGGGVSFPPFAASGDLNGMGSGGTFFKDMLG